MIEQIDTELVITEYPKTTPLERTPNEDSLEAIKEKLPSILSGDIFVSENSPNQDIETFQRSQKSFIRTTFPPMKRVEEYFIFSKYNEIKNTLKENPLITEEDHENLEESFKNLELFIIYSNHGLLYSFVNKYGYTLPREDASQSGNLGIIKAIRRFDINRGNRFYTYAKHWVLGEIQQSELKHKQMRLEHWLETLIKEMERESREYEIHSNHLLNPKEKKDLLLKYGYKEENIQTLLEKNNYTEIQSLDTNITIEGENTDLHDFIEDSNALNIQDQFLDQGFLYEVIFSSDLTNKQLITLFLRSGLYDGQRYNGIQISKPLKCEPQNIYEIGTRTISKMRTGLRKVELKGQENRGPSFFSEPKQVREFILNQNLVPQV